MKNKRSFFYALAFVLIAGVLNISCEGSETETGETILDPIQPIIVPDSSTHAIGGSSEQKLAQTFTINHNGTLTGVFLPLDCSSGDLDIEIRNVDGDEPGTTVLTNQRFNADSLVTGVTVFKLFSLPGLMVSTGDRMTLVLNNSGGTCGMSSGPIGNPYTGGEGFFDARPNEPGWVPFSEFDSTAQDLAFQVLLERV